MFAPTRERYYRFNQVDTRKYGSFAAPFIEWKPRPRKCATILIWRSTGCRPSLFCNPERPQEAKDIGSRPPASMSLYKSIAQASS